MVTSGGLGGVMVSMLAPERQTVLVANLWAQYFPFSLPLGHWGHDHDPVQAIRCMVVESTLCMYM